MITSNEKSSRNPLGSRVSLVFVEMAVPSSEKPVLVLVRSVETPTRQIFAGRAKSFWADETNSI